MATPITPGPSFAFGEAQRLFSITVPGFFASNSVPYYDITPDDRRFVMVRLAAVNQAPGAGQLVVVDNWDEELKTRMQSRR